MAATPSTMLALGTELPRFSLPDLAGRIVSDSDYRNRTALVVAFLCPHCTYVKHVRDRFVQVANEYHPKNVAFVAINSNDAAAFPDDGPDGMKREAAESAFTFPYLYDESQEAAKAFKAACTPDF